MDKKLISSRFKEVLNDLKIKKKLKGYEVLAKSYDPKNPKDKSFISEMANGRVIPNEDVVDYLASKFNVNKEYIYEGIGTMYINSTWEDEAPYLKTNQDMVQAATIKMLFHEVAKLKAKIFSLKYSDCVSELEQNTTSILRDMLKEKE